MERIAPVPVAGVCEWFSGCTRPASAWVYHPWIGCVPSCERCIGKLNLGGRIIEEIVIRGSDDGDAQ